MLVVTKRLLAGIFLLVLGIFDLGLVWLSAEQMVREPLLAWVLYSVGVILIFSGLVVLYCTIDDISNKPDAILNDTPE